MCPSLYSSSQSHKPFESESSHSHPKFFGVESWLGRVSSSEVPMNLNVLHSPLIAVVSYLHGWRDWVESWLGRVSSSEVPMNLTMLHSPLIGVVSCLRGWSDCVFRAIEVTALPNHISCVHDTSHWHSAGNFWLLYLAKVAFGFRKSPVLAFTIHALFHEFYLF